MKVAVIGRTRPLLEAARLLVDRGHALGVVWTCRTEEFYGVGGDDFRALAERAGAPFRDDLGIASAEALAWLRSLGCAGAVSMNWLTVLPQPLLDLFPLGVLNAHAGDLPRYRGNACPNWAILAGEPRVGLCVHRMTPQLDAGPVVLREHLPLGSDTYIGDVYGWLEERIPVMLADGLEGLAEGRLTPEPQPTDPSLALRVYPRRPEDGRIHWSQPADRIHRLVRASSRPFAGAFAFLEGGRRVTAWRADPFPPPEPFLAVPGQVCLMAGEDPVVACGAGMLRLTEVAVEGCADDAEAKRLIGCSLRNRLT